MRWKQKLVKRLIQRKGKDGLDQQGCWKENEKWLYSGYVLKSKANKIF